MVSTRSSSPALTASPSTADGTGQTIAIVDAFDDPNIALDLKAFDQQFNLPAPPSFTKVDQDGGTDYPPENDGWAGEISLDVEWVHAMAPGANIVLVEAKSDDTIGDLLPAIDYARSLPGVVAISMSFGYPELKGDLQDDSHFTTPAGHVGGGKLPGGITFVAASGDSGAPPSYPATSPNVLSVGGTTLSLDAFGNILAETGWSGSGGGISTVEPLPTYQQGVAGQGTSNRTNPDVAV